jgi:murein DD-endopeptidase MepM/ murein hydrolase activator NlpD
VSASFHAGNHARPGRRHAVDLVPAEPDPTVLAPCAGRVVACARHHAEGAASANEFHLQRDDGLTVVLSHLRGDSVRVEVGERVAQGDELARLGNTGHTTGLHMHLELRGADGKTVPFTVAGRVPVKGGTIAGSGQGQSAVR